MPGDRLPPATPAPAAPAPAASPATSDAEDDELDDLPPIDGDGDDAEADAGQEEGAEDLDDDATGDPNDPLDDSTGEDDPLDEELDVGDEDGEAAWLDDAGDSEGLDVGALEDLAGGGEEDGAALLEGAEEQDAEEEDLGFGEKGEGETASGDAGEEGFVGDDEELREEDLPRLDADGDANDEEGIEADENELLETTDERDGDGDEEAEESRPAWADRAWERAGGDVRGLAAVDALACDSVGVVVGGQGLARIDAAGVVTVLEAAGLRGGALRSVSVDGACIVVTTPRAGVLVSTDAGASFVEANDWRAHVGKDDAASVVDVATMGAELWARGKSGALAWSGDRGATWASVAGDTKFEAIAADRESGAVIAFARGDASGCVVARCAGGRVELTKRAPLAGAGTARVVALAARAGRLAVGFAGRGAFVSDVATHEGGWTRVEGSASLSALTFGAHDALVIALHSEAEARAWIVESRPGAEADARTVAEIDAQAKDKDDDGDAARVRALSLDERTGVLWAAGGFGIAALQASKK